MNVAMLIILIALTILMSIQNFKRVKQYRKDKAYVDLYTKVLRGDESVHEELDKYIGSETDPCLNTKARIIKAYDQILLGINPSEQVKDIDIKNIFYVNDKFSIEKSKLNSEIFVWLTLMLSKARCLSMIDFMNKLYAKVQVCKDDLNVLVEYQVFNAAYNSLLEKGTDGIEFLKKLLGGDYGDYAYDKNLIGIYKKIACCLLEFTGEPLSEDDEAMLPEFTGTLVGNRFTRDLDIYDKFAPKSDDTSSNEQTPIEEPKEETGEVANEPSKENEEPKEDDAKEDETSNEEIKEDNPETTEESSEETKETVEEETQSSSNDETIEETPEANDEHEEEKAEGVQDNTPVEDSDSNVQALKSAEDELIESIGDIGEY